MHSKTRVFISESSNPWFNLATEDWIFHDLDGVDQVLFLWRNQETVVIGRSQNPWLECKLDKMEKDGVLLARRQSGGGAVYHDLGNTNFTFLSKKKNYDKKRNLEIIIAALGSLGVAAEFSGRNDILTKCSDPRKISGNAFKEKQDRAFHHGTLLINANLTRLVDYLNPHPKKLEAKGVASVKSRVANLVEYNPDVTHELVCQRIIGEFNRCYGGDAVAEILSPDQLSTIQALDEHYKHLQSWDWRFGQTLPFTHQFDHRFDWGMVDVRLVVKKAHVEAAQIYSDAMQPEWLEHYALSMIGKPYDVALADLLCDEIGAVPDEQVVAFKHWLALQLR